MNPSAIQITPIVPIVQDKLEALKGRNDFVDNMGDLPEVGKQGSAVTDDVYTATGHCDFFDLSKESDRVAYAELCAKFAAGTSFQLNWEERIPNDKGALNVIVTYMEYVLVHHSETVSVNIKDFK